MSRSVSCRAEVTPAANRATPAGTSDLGRRGLRRSESRNLAGDGIIPRGAHHREWNRTHSQALPHEGYGEAR